MENLIERYKSFLDNGKTERECVKEVIERAEKEGYKNMERPSPSTTLEREIWKRE